MCRDPPQSVENLHATLSDAQQLMAIKAQIMFVSDMCQPILDAMSSFESQKPCTLSAFDKLEELLIALEANALTAVVMDKFHNDSDCDTLSLDRRTKNIEVFHDAFQAAADKLHKYVSEKDGGEGWWSAGYQVSKGS